MAVIQRFGGALNLNVHIHALVLEGVVARNRGDVTNRPLRADAVAGIIERWRDDGDPEVSWRDREDATANAAVGGRPVW